MSARVSARILETACESCGRPLELAQGFEPDPILCGACRAKRAATVDLAPLRALVFERAHRRHELEQLEERLRDELRAARAAGARKTDLARLVGVARPTLDAWLNDGEEQGQ